MDVCVVCCTVTEKAQPGQSGQRDKHRKSTKREQEKELMSCHVELFATGRSPVQGSVTDLCVSMCVIYKPQ